MNWVVVAILVLVLARMAKAGVESDRVARIARAIAKAEGWYVENSKPRRYNNPGALIDPMTKDLKRFPNEAAGWAALYDYVEDMLSGASRYYSPTMSIREIAEIYTGGDKPDAWARIVSRELGVSPDTPIGAIV